MYGTDGMGTHRDCLVRDKNNSMDRDYGSTRAGTAHEGPRSRANGSSRPMFGNSRASPLLQR